MKMSDGAYQTLLAEMGLRPTGHEDRPWHGPTGTLLVVMSAWALLHDAPSATQARTKALVARAKALPRQAVTRATHQAIAAELGAMQSRAFDFNRACDRVEAVIARAERGAV